MQPSSRLLFVSLLLSSLGAAATSRVPGERRQPAPAPHVAGRVAIDPQRGTLHAAVCLMPDSGAREVRFLLNAALNIARVTDSSDSTLVYRGDFNGRMIGESREYVVERSGFAAHVRPVCVSYQGAIPVFDRNVASSDWKGRIAAMRGTIRATEQARWLPTVFDSASGVIHDAMTYALHVECTGCSGIYVNGAPPVRGSSGEFRSAVPRGIFLYAGAIAFRETPQALFVGASVSDSAATLISRELRLIAQDYEGQLAVPYGERPVFLSFTSVARHYPPGVIQWQFVTWPTVALSGGVSFDSLVATVQSAPQLRGPLRASLAHEMAHFYFGTHWVPWGPLRWIGLESCAEFMALRVVRRVDGEFAWIARLNAYVQEIGRRGYPPVGQIRDAGEYDEAFRYRAIPLALVGLEEAVGSRPMTALMRELLGSPADRAFDVRMLRAAAARSGIADSLLEAHLLSGYQYPRLVASLSQRALERYRGDATDDALTILVGQVNTDSTPAGRATQRRLLRRWIGSEPRRARLLYQSGKLAALSGDALSEGARHLQQYIAIPPSQRASDPATAEAWVRLGQIAERRKQPEEAMRAYRSAIRESPGHALATAAVARLSK